MGSTRDVIEISSDEEDSNWIDKLLDSSDFGAGTGEGLDDLMVMGLLSAPLVTQKKRWRDGGGSCDDDNDDCVVLDGDPDKVVTVAEEKRSWEYGSDELQIVAEKGPLACRDFPHPRHLCASLPFSTTSHAKHCSMCHCFVCDSPAPCTYWGKGTLITDHCHATDKGAKWKTLRQSFKHKSLPACHPGKLPSFFMYPAPVVPLTQQDKQRQVSIPQPPSSLRSNVVRPSAGRTPVPNNAGQNQQVHMSIRVPQHVGQAASAPKASSVPQAGTGSGSGDACAAQVTYSRKKSKRVGAAPPGYATSSANRFQSAVLNNAPVHPASTHVSQPAQVAPNTVSSGTFQNNVPQRSLRGSIVSQGHQSQPIASVHVAQNRAHGTRPQLSRCTSLAAERMQCLSEPLVDVNSQSWQDILASLESELGVSTYNIDTTLAQQPVNNSSQHLHSGAYQVVNFHGKSAAAATHLRFPDGHGFLNHSTGDNLHAYDPAPATQALSHVNSESDLAIGETLLGAANQIESLFDSGPAIGRLKPWTD